jgi:thiamine transporter ThiT
MAAVNRIHNCLFLCFLVRLAPPNMIGFRDLLLLGLIGLHHDFLFHFFAVILFFGMYLWQQCS